MLRLSRSTLGRPLKLPINAHKEFLVHTAGKTNLPELHTEVTIDSDMPFKWLEFMTRMRRMETLNDQCYKLKKIRGFCHLYIGQEAIATGMNMSLSATDSVITAYRAHVWHVVRGGTIEEVFGEMQGKQMGCSKGKGGSMHMYKVDKHYFGGNGIVGAQVPLGAGLAWKYALTNGVESPGNVSVALYGDGAANQGQIFEAYNMCELWKVPVIFVCENNHFGMGTSTKRASASQEFYTRGDYIPGLRADGMNVFSVMEATRWAREYALAGNGPVLLEMDSYRYVGHSMSDPDSAYRTRDDIKKVRDERDCIVHMRKVCLDNSLATEAEIKDMEKRVKSELEAILAKVEASPDTAMDELTGDVLADQKNYGPIRTCQGTVFYQ